MTWIVRLLIAVIACAIVGTPARAQVARFDHLLCSKVKDKTKKAKFTVNLVPRLASQFPALTGCTVKVPAKLLCFDVAKTSVTPTPPGTVSGPENGERFLCYNVKCPKQNVPSVPVNDQFGGARTVSANAANMLCAPASLTSSPTGAFVAGSSE
jgi:hypothetical protein